MFGMAPPPHIVKGLIIWGLGIGCVGFCLAVGLVYLIYRFAYKASKQSPPEPNNDQKKAEVIQPRHGMIVIIIVIVIGATTRCSS